MLCLITTRAGMAYGNTIQTTTKNNDESFDENVLDVPFGHDLLLRQEFLLRYINFNHGSFGSCPKSVLDYQSSLRLLQEEQPDPWMRHDYKKMINDTRAHVAAFVNSPRQQDIVLVGESCVIMS